VKRDGTTAVNGALSVAGNQNVGGALSVSGNQNLGGALSVAGNQSVAGTLSVAGNQSVGGALSVSRNQSVGGALSVSGNQTVGGALSVSGNQTVGGALSVAGNLSMGQSQEIAFADNGQIRSLDNNHRLMFRRAENVMELREYGEIRFSPGATGGAETNKVTIDSAGNLRVTGRLLPNFDSGWVGDDNKTHHVTKIDHNLGDWPTLVQLWFTVNNLVYPITWSWDATASGNPVTVEYTKTSILLHIFSGAPLHGAWSGASKAWNYYTTGYWRVFAWK
jgi:hypothetical protein